MPAFKTVSVLGSYFSLKISAFQTLLPLEISIDLWSMRGMDIFWKHTLVQEVFYYKFVQELEGLSLRAGGWGFPPTNMNVAPGYSRWKIKQK